MYLGHGLHLSMSRDVIGHVIIFPRYVVSYRWSVDTCFLTGTVTEIFVCKVPITRMSSHACIFPV